ncbi:MAG: thermonuclease family protein [Actinomycetota bacterium]
MVAVLLAGRGPLLGRNDHGSAGSIAVDRVVDGDTLVIEMGGRPHTVRLLGIDTPETVARSVPVQCFGAEASAALGQLLPPGTPVRVHREAEGRDHYDRLLLHVVRHADGLHVNRWLVEEGYAAAVSYEPNTFHRSAFAAAERRARAEGRGLWSACDGPDQPLDPS